METRYNLLLGASLLATGVYRTGQSNFLFSFYFLNFTMKVNKYDAKTMSAIWIF